MAFSCLGDADEAQRYDPNSNDEMARVPNVATVDENQILEQEASVPIYPVAPPISANSYERQALEETNPCSKGRLMLTTTWPLVRKA